MHFLVLSLAKVEHALPFGPGFLYFFPVAMEVLVVGRARDLVAVCYGTWWSNLCDLDDLESQSLASGELGSVFGFPAASFVPPVLCGAWPTDLVDSSPVPS